MHLTPEQLLDLAEGSPPEESAQHLTDCEVCRRQIEELREVMAGVRVDVPEPSPLFWDHLSARVREAIEAEHRRWWHRLWHTGRRNWRVAAAMSAAVAMAALVLHSRTPPSVPGSASLAAPAVADDGAFQPAGDDPSLTLLGDLAGGLDWDGAVEAGIGADAGATETAIAELNAGERAELQRLLRDAMAGA